MTNPGSGQQWTLRRRNRRQSFSAYDLQALNVSTLHPSTLLIQLWYMVGYRHTCAAAVLAGCSGSPEDLQTSSHVWVGRPDVSRDRQDSK